MSIGPVVDSFDKKGYACNIVDIIVSPEVLRKSMSDLLFRNNLQSLIRETLNKEYALKIDKQTPWRVLKIQYKGETIQSQRIRVPRERLINEVKLQLDKKSPHEIIPFEMILINPKTGESLDYLQYARDHSTEVLLQRALEEDMGSKTRSVIIKTDLGLLTMIQMKFLNIRDPSSCRIKISNQRLQITTRGITDKDMHIWFPVQMAPETATSEYLDKEECVLVRIHASKVH
jgi:hypothetical protein